MGAEAVLALMDATPETDACVVSLEVPELFLILKVFLYVGNPKVQWMFYYEYNGLLFDR